MSGTPTHSAAKAVQDAVARVRRVSDSIQEAAGFTPDNLFYEEIIRKFPEYINAHPQVRSIDKRPIKENDTRYMAECFMKRVLGVKKDAEGKTSDFMVRLFAKFPPKDIPANFKIVVEDAFLNESYAYNVVFKDLEKYTNLTFAIPKGFWGDNNIIVLDHIFYPSGFHTLADQACFTMTQIKQVLHEIAKLHAASILMREAKPDEYQSMCHRLHNFVIKKLRYDPLVGLDKDINHQRLISKGSDEQFPPERRRRVARLLRKIQEFEDNKKIFEPAHPFRVINHGELSCENIMFNSQGNEVCLVDWQTMRSTSMGADLSYFFYSNVSPQDQLAHRDTLLSYYLEKVQEFLALRPEVHHHLTDRITLEVLQNEIEKFDCFGFLYDLWRSPAYFIKNKFKKAMVVDGVNQVHKENVMKLVLKWVERDEVLHPND